MSGVIKNGEQILDGVFAEVRQNQAGSVWKLLETFKFCQQDKLVCCCEKALFGVDSKVQKRVGTLEYKYIQIHLELCKYLLRYLGIHQGKWCPSISGWGCP